MSLKRRITLIKGIIFDLDGTLIDSMGIWSDIDRKFLLENGVNNPPADISEIMRKMSVDESTDYFITRFGLKCTREYIKKRIEELVYHCYSEVIPLKSGVGKLLDYLDDADIPYGVATATYKNLAEAILNRYGILGRFKFLLTDSEYPGGKNSPEIYYGAAKKLGFEPHEIMVAEDSLHCIETARSAGFFTVGVYDETSDFEWELIKERSNASVRFADEIIDLIGRDI